MADNIMVVASLVYIWIKGKIPWTEQDALDFRSCSLKLTVVWWDTVTVYCTGIQNMSLDQKICLNVKYIFGSKAEQSRNDWKKNCAHHALWSLWFDHYCWSTAVLLLFYSFSFSLWLSRYFSLFFSISSLWVLVFFFSFSQTFFSPSSSDYFIIKLSRILLSFLCFLPEFALLSCLPLGQCCCLISILRFTSAVLGCTGLGHYGYSGLKQATTCDTAKHSKTTNDVYFCSAIWHTLVFVVRYSIKRSCSPHEFQVASD